MKPFGDLLKEAREEHGETLEAITEETRIGKRFLEALEASDLETLPGGPFNKGYIRSYAQYLGIDPQPFLDAYDAQARARVTPESEEEMLAELSRLAAQNSARRPPSHSNGIRLALAVAFLGLIGVVGWYFFPRSRSTADEAPPKVVTATPSDSSSQHETTDPPAVPKPTVDTSTDQEAEAPPVQLAVDADPEPNETTTEMASNTPPPPDPASIEQPSEQEKSSTTEDDPSSRLAVSGFGVGTGVRERSLVGKSDRFPEGSQVWFWTRVIGGESGDVLRHYWLYEGRTVKLFELAVGGPHWRTHSNYIIPSGSTGNYVVEARGLDGKVLARQEFQCVPKPNAQVQR